MENKRLWKIIEEIASNSNCKKRHVGAAITDKAGDIVASGFNNHEHSECDCGDKGTGNAIHAEIMAVNNIPVQRREEELYAYVNHKPCERCMTILSSICKEVYINATSVKFDTQKELLKERKNTHGNFQEMSEYTQRAKELMRKQLNWFTLERDKRESLDMIQHKIGRILLGDPDHKDHWTDIGGYSKIVEEHLDD